MYRAALSDADGTLFPGFAAFPVCEYMADTGFVNSSDNDRIQGLLAIYEHGRLPYGNFVKLALQCSVQILEGKSEAEATDIATDYFESDAFAPYTYVNHQLAYNRHEGISNVLVTGEPQFIAEAIGRVLGFDKTVSSTFETDQKGCFTGKIATVLDSRGKAKAIKELGIDSITLAVGDTSGDIGMLELADEGFCVTPDKALKEAALRNGWHIIEDPNTHIALTSQTRTEQLAAM